MESLQREFKSKTDMYEDCQQTIMALPGVLNARFSFDKGGEVSEIHVLSDVSRSPKQILRDIQSTLYARYNLVLDRRIVSIAQLQTGVARTADRCRLSCDKVELCVTKDASTASVTLVSGEEDFVGKSTAANTPYGKSRMVAEATINAVSEYLRDSGRFTVVDVREIEAAGVTIELVLVSLNSPGGCEILVGAACNEQDKNYAIAKASLDAINRKMQSLN